MMSLNRLHKALLFIFPILSLLLADAPAWSINPAEFQYNGSVTSKVYIDGDEVGSTSDLVAAFVGDEVRGVVNGLGLPSFLGGGYSFNVMIFSNEAGGDDNKAEIKPVEGGSLQVIIEFCIPFYNQLNNIGEFYYV